MSAAAASGSSTSSSPSLPPFSPSTSSPTSSSMSTSRASRTGATSASSSSRWQARRRSCCRRRRTSRSSAAAPCSTPSLASRRRSWSGLVAGLGDAIGEFSGYVVGFAGPGPDQEPEALPPLRGLDAAPRHADDLPALHLPQPDFRPRRSRGGRRADAACEVLHRHAGRQDRQGHLPRLRRLVLYRAVQAILCKPT